MIEIERKYVIYLPDMEIIKKQKPQEQSFGFKELLCRIAIIKLLKE